jgi:carnitine 3-dehydrogenase
MGEIATVGIAGTGLIGAGWAARLLIRGIDVVAFDPAPAAEAKLRAAIDVAWPSMERLIGRKPARPGRLTFTTVLRDMAKAADFVQEAAPEREELKIRLFREIGEIARPDVIIASSSSGFLPSRLQSQCPRPERVLIGHPFNPVYLLPLVETVPGKETSAAFMDQAGAFYTSIGMHVLRLKKEIPGYICDRLQEALWREALHCLNKDVGSTGDIDDAITYSAGLRWAFMGSFMTYHLAGGPGGMRDFIRQFDPGLELPWTDLRYPKWSDKLERRLIEGCEAQAAGRSVAEIEAKRNEVLVDLLRLLKQHRIGAGLALAREDEEARAEPKPVKHWKPGAKIAAPLKSWKGTVDPAWLDYNGHMTEAAFLTAFGEATDMLFRFIGDDESYRASGRSFYTVETHMNFLRELKAGQPVAVETLLIGFDDKRMHLFHRMFRRRELVATAEQMLLHVDSKAAKASAMPPEQYAALEAIAEAHRGLDRPAELGRTMRVPKPKQPSRRKTVSPTDGNGRRAAR